MSRLSKKSEVKKDQALKKKVLKFVVDSCLFELNEDDHFAGYLVEHAIELTRSRLGFGDECELSHDDEVKVSVMATRLVGQSIAQVNKALRNLKSKRPK